MKLRVWRMSLPAGQSFDEHPPVPQAVQVGVEVHEEGGERVEMPLWEIDVETVEQLVEIVRAADGEAELVVDDAGVELRLP